MLPSMPLLMTPVKELRDDSSDTSDDSPSPHHLAENEHTFESSVVEASIQNEEMDHIGTLDECIPETRTIEQTDIEKVIDKQNTPEKRSLTEPTSAQKKKKKTQHKKILTAVTPESGDRLERSAQNFAEAYFRKVKSQLDDDKWAQFVKDLLEFEAKNDKQPAELYRRMEVLLSPYKELIDEFLGFLLPHQAQDVNRFMDYLLLVKMKEFLRKLDILLLKRQTRQVFSALGSLAIRPNVSPADVKASILPLLKSSPLLTNEFLQLLPGERPPDSLMTDFEQMDFKDDSMFETIVVPDCPDPYGNANCICSCHATQKNRHCVSCGIKYLNGRVYLQHGKALRPAKVTFRGRKHMDLCKWEEDKFRSRKRLLPKTMLSPSCLDHRLNADSEDDCGVKKSPRTPRIRAARPKVCKKGSMGTKDEVLEGIFPLAETNNVVIGSSIMEELVVDCEMKHNGNDEHEFDEVVLENECNTEEDEEEDFNKCSENESSLEAEDIAKELESGNDCSFEDDDGDDIEDSEAQSEMTQTSSVNDVQEELSVESLCHEKSVFPCSSSDSERVKIDPIQSENYTKENNLILGIRFGSNLPVKQELETTSESELQEEISVGKDPRRNTNNELDEICKVEPTELAFLSEGALVKACASVDIMDICYDKGSTSLKCEFESFSENSCKEESLEENSDRCDVETVKNTSEQDSVCKEWTREEDKIILQTFQHENGLEQTFQTASLQLPNRSKTEIQERFEVLLKLLKEMISDESNSNP